MSGLSTLFGWGQVSVNSDELPDIFPLSIAQDVFVTIDSLNIFMKILTDVVERTHGITDDIQPLLWDNCLKSESKDGLITLLSKAATKKDDLFLVYDPALNLLRKANPEEQDKIRTDYEKTGTSKTGAFVSFKNYLRADMITLYSALEYCTVASLNKNMNLSKAIQFKMNDLRGTVSMNDAAVIETKARLVVQGMSRGKDVLLDSKDLIETAKPDLTATKEAMAFLDTKRAFYLGMTASYITGEAPKGLGDSGEGDSKAVERGLKNYYFSIIKPVFESVFGIKTTFKSQDFRQVSSALEALKTFSLVGTELVSLENQNIIINKLLDLDEDAKGDVQPKVDPALPIGSANVPHGAPPFGAKK